MPSRDESFRAVGRPLDQTKPSRSPGVAAASGSELDPKAAADTAPVELAPGAQTALQQLTPS